MRQMVIAQTPRLLLRQLCVEDAEAMHHVLGDPIVMQFSDGVKSKEQVAEWINGWIDELYGRWGFGIWAVVEKQEKLTIGHCGLSRFAGRCAGDETEIGFRLARTHWGRGLASEAAAAVRDYAFVSLHLPKLIAIVDPANLASIRVVTKVGFRYEREVMFEGYDHADHVYALMNPTGG